MPCKPVKCKYFTSLSPPAINMSSGVLQLLASIISLITLTTSLPCSIIGPCFMYFTVFPSSMTVYTSLAKLMSLQNTINGFFKI